MDDFLDISPDDRAAFHRLTKADTRQCNNAFHLLARAQRMAVDLGYALAEGETPRVAMAVSLHCALEEIETKLRALHEQQRIKELRRLGVDPARLEAWFAARDLEAAGGPTAPPASSVFLDESDASARPTPAPVRLDVERSGAAVQHTSGGSFDAAMMQLQRAACIEAVGFVVVYIAKGKVYRACATCKHCDEETRQTVPRMLPAIDAVITGIVGASQGADAVSAKPDQPTAPAETRWKCNGGPNAARWCGLAATHVGRDELGIEWFCCPEHTEGAGTRPDTRLLPLAEWLRRADLVH